MKQYLVIEGDSLSGVENIEYIKAVNATEIKLW